MENKRSACLAMMNSTCICNEFPIHSKYSSLIDMITIRGDEYPSDSHLDYFDHANTFDDQQEFKKIQKLYNFPKPFILVLAEPDDRSCH